jgi:RimJ/RimL family protein N-acetyltransferase
VDERYVTDLHQLVEKNKHWLQHSLSWPAAVDSEDETRRHVQGNVMLHQRGYAKMFLLFLRDEMVGVLSFNQIEPLNKTAISATGLMNITRDKGCFPRRCRRLCTTTLAAAKSGAS